MGYHRAGFDVVGVDINPQPRYPFEFHQADAMTFTLEHFDAIHASPPCQKYSVASNGQDREKYPDLYQPVKDMLERHGKPYIIENVVRSPVRADISICGCHVGLPRLRRRRNFETNWSGLVMMPPCNHGDADIVTICGHGTPSGMRQSRLRKGLHPNISVDEKREIMGMPWANRYEIAQAIPPAYTEFIGKKLIERLT